MLIENEAKTRLTSEIMDLYTRELAEEPVKGLIHFGAFSEKSGELMAVASLKNYMGSWYLRGCVVKPEFRGLGLQRSLIKERLEYLKDKAHTARVSVYPENTHSIANIETSGFVFEKKKKLENGEVVLVYKCEW